MELEHYAEAVERLKKKCNMIINLSTGPGGQLTVGPDNQPKMDQSIMATPEKRVEHILKLKPELCSLDIGSSNAGFGVFVNAQLVIDKMAEMIKTGRGEAGDRNLRYRPYPDRQPAYQAGPGGEERPLPALHGDEDGRAGHARATPFIFPNLCPRERPGRSSAWARPISPWWPWASSWAGMPGSAWKTMFT